MSAPIKAEFYGGPWHGRTLFVSEVLTTVEVHYPPEPMIQFVGDMAFHAVKPGAAHAYYRCVVHFPGRAIYVHSDKQTRLFERLAYHCGSWEQAYIALCEATFVASIRDDAILQAAISGATDDFMFAIDRISTRRPSRQQKPA